MTDELQQLEAEFRRRIGEHLKVIYPEESIDGLTERLVAEIGMGRNLQEPTPYSNHWDESDCVLITYGNSVQSPGEKPLQTLRHFIDTNLDGVISAAHILPFFPFSSDDGFSVMDYLAINPTLGDWEDIENIGKDYKLMADLVLNHMSSRSLWFENFRKRIDPGKDYFCEGDPDADYAAVVRPRNSPLLTAVETADGVRHVWCTFSADQVDLNFRNPQVLIEFVRIIREYLNHGITLFRFDAVPFLWKEPGSACIHLQQTHEIIKLLRTLIEHHAPAAIIICENNVPNRENLTYFGNANEAHVIYNFSLPPLLVHTLLSGDCRHLKTWLMSMPPAQDGTTYLNFIASHDGIGLRPLDGLLSDTERQQIVDKAQEFGGHVTFRRAREGYDKPYELNIALYDMLKGTIAEGEDRWGFERFVCAHAIMLALEGIPAVYIQSLFGSRNDLKRLEHTGRARSINRHIWDAGELQALLNEPQDHQGRIFSVLTRLIRIRRAQPAFHPNATQFTMHLGTAVFAFWRQSSSRDQSIFCLNNVTPTEQVINLADINLIGTDQWHDLISDAAYDDLGQQLRLGPYQSVWISNRRRQETGHIASL